MIHVDLDHPRVSRRPKASRCSCRPAATTPYLQQVVRLLGTIYDGLEMSPPMFAAFDELALIEPIALEIELATGDLRPAGSLHDLAGRLAALDGGRAFAPAPRRPAGAAFNGWCRPWAT
jgi:hypothetical protein